MSYNRGWDTNPNGEPAPISAFGYQGTPMALDIAVLQAKYGANLGYRTGADTYLLPSSNEVGTFYSCIWDAGGIDTIVHDGSAPAVIDLRPATLEVEEGGGGFLSYVDARLRRLHHRERRGDRERQGWERRGRNLRQRFRQPPRRPRRR